MTPVPRHLVPWFPTIDAAACDTCGNCLSFCKHGVYAQGDTTMTVAAPFNCVVGCSGCQPQCPNGAISFPELEAFVAELRSIRAQYAADTSQPS